MNDKLCEIFNIQKQFERKFLEYENQNIDDISLDKRQEYTKEWILSLIKECTEVLDCINWKKHKITKEKINKSNLTEELVDVFKFFLAICIIWDIDEKVLHEEFIRKSLVVDQKFEQEKLMNLKLKKDSKMCALDIDGVLFPWPDVYMKFVEINYPEYSKYSFEELESMPIKQEIKDAYRMSGIKSAADCINGASDFTKKLRKAGYKIILLTSRPYEKYFRIYADTLQWISKNNIIFDAIIWNHEKEKYLYENFKGMIKFVVEDDDENIKKLRNYGFKVFKKDSNIEFDEIIKLI